MSISRWSSNHQNGDVLSLLSVFVAYIVDRLRRTWIYCAFDVEDVGAKCFGSQEANEVVVVIH